jgi:hypothetical protein
MMRRTNSTTRHGAPRAAASRVQWRPDDRYGVLLTALMWTLLVLMIVPEGFDYSLLANVNRPPPARR